MKQLNFRECALYVRVSTDKQDELSPDAQIRLGTEYAKKNGLHLHRARHIRKEGRQTTGVPADDRRSQIRRTSF